MTYYMLKYVEQKTRYRGFKFKRVKNRIIIDSFFYVLTLLKSERRRGTIECNIVQIVFMKNHINWLMPIGARECNLNIQLSSTLLLLVYQILVYITLAQ